MKLRLRLKKVVRTVEVIDAESENFTVDELSGRVSNAFEDVIAGDFCLSLNNKDELEGGKKLKECDIVSGDLIYIVPCGEWRERLEAGSSGATPSSSNSSASSSLSQGSNKSVNKTHSVLQETVGCAGGSTQQNNGTLVKSDSKDKEMLVDGGNALEECDSSVECAMETSQVDLNIVQQCLSEPILCREATDGRLPALLIELYNNSKPKNVAESISIVLHVLMLETGFSTYPELEISKLPDNFRCRGCYKFTYTYPGCQETLCTVTNVPTGSTIMAHGKVDGDSNFTRKCSIKPHEFVQAVSEDCTECYCQLAKLSMLFKDAVCIPLVNDIRQASGLPDLFGLLALTQEVKLKILSYLDVKSLIQMSSVNQEFQEVCGDPYIWRRLYLKEFGNRSNMSLSQDWKKLYKHEYKLRKERRKALNRMKIVTPPFWGPQVPHGGASNWIPPPMPGGIIGGDYDLFTNFPGGYPGVPGRSGQQPPILPRPRYDLIGPTPDVDPGPDPDLIPSRPRLSGRGGGSGRLGPFGTGGGFGPRFF